MSGLEALSPPEPRRLTVAGRDFALTPVRMGRLAAFSKAALPVSGLVLAGQYAMAITENWPDMRQAVAIGAQVEPEWLDELDPSDFLRLVQAVVEVNGSFFVQRLTPLILAMQAQMAGAMSQIGDESSQPSENTARH